MKLQVMVAALSIVFGGAAHAAPIYGDVNGNSSVDLGDAVVLCKVAGGLAPITDTIRRYGDVGPVRDYNAGLFGDGKIDLVDAVGVAVRAAHPGAGAFPAKASFYQLEVGNTFTLRKYNSSGIATTGPSTANPDIIQTVARTQTDTLASGSYPVFVITGSDGSEQHIGNATAGDGQAQLIVSQGLIGGQRTSFDPPLVVLKGPVQAGTTWSGSTSTTLSGYPTSPTYNGRIDDGGPLNVPFGATKMNFATTYKVTLAYTGTVVLPFVGTQSYSGNEYYWFVPFVGPVQHGFDRVFPFQAPTSVNPDLSLVAANIHGVLYP